MESDGHQHLLWSCRFRHRSTHSTGSRLRSLGIFEERQTLHLGCAEGFIPKLSFGFYRLVLYLAFNCEHHLMPARNLRNFDQYIYNRVHLYLPSRNSKTFAGPCSYSHCFDPLETCKSSSAGDKSIETFTLEVDFRRCRQN